MEKFKDIKKESEASSLANMLHVYAQRIWWEFVEYCKRTEK